MIGLSSQFGGARKQEVAGENRRSRGPTRVQRGHAAPQECAVDQIIVDQCRRMKQFHRGAKGDEFLLGRAQHVADEQAQGRPDAFSSRRQQMLKGGTQIGMMFLSSLFPNPLFNKLELFVYRCEKSCRAQTVSLPNRTSARRSKL